MVGQVLVHGGRGQRLAGQVGWLGDGPPGGWVTGQPLAVRTGLDLDDVNRYWCFYAHASDGAYWAGPYKRMVPHSAYEWCEWTSNTDSRLVGFRLLDIDSHDDYTVNLVP